MRHLTRRSCETCSSPSLTSSVLYWLESAALNDLLGYIQPCLTLPKHCLGNIYSAHYSFVQQTSPQSLSPRLLGKLCTFSTWLNCKCPAPRAARLCNARSPACTLLLTHPCTRGCPYRAKPHRGPELSSHFILRPSLRDSENNDHQDAFHVLSFVLLSFISSKNKPEL